ncbi:hypothetical protein CALCODRAFT_98357 [Calocera cornea HHB12733]|uniref:Uncharacterized protein n=1 Tax=Calocera cornea HHB12733 TaxID=1353952 RepID=A0A165D7G7_9BASI|nr:hypothetical protein CALCODRAFT_98357 [Calocera cornea HHB12733]
MTTRAGSNEVSGRPCGWAGAGWVCECILRPSAPSVSARQEQAVCDELRGSNPSTHPRLLHTHPTATAPRAERPACQQHPVPSSPIAHRPFPPPNAVHIQPRVRFARSKRPPYRSASPAGARCARTRTLRAVPWVLRKGPDASARGGCDDGGLRVDPAQFALAQQHAPHRRRSLLPRPDLRRASALRLRLRLQLRLRLPLPLPPHGRPPPQPAPRLAHPRSGHPRAGPAARHPAPRPAPPRPVLHPDLGTELRFGSSRVRVRLRMELPPHPSPRRARPAMGHPRPALPRRRSLRPILRPGRAQPASPARAGRRLPRGDRTADGQWHSARGH